MIKFNNFRYVLFKRIKIKGDLIKMFTLQNQLKIISICLFVFLGLLIYN
ncbi:SVM family protein [Candidatus Phytoplasma crotalariae]